MGNYDRRPSFRERVAKFMAGRYGIDRFFYFLLGIYFILSVVNIFVRTYVIVLINFVIMIFAIWRILSRNIYKRQRENEFINKVLFKANEIHNLQKCKKRDRKTHVYKKCPSCRNNLRLPKVKGKHTVVCPCCKHRFETKI